VNKENYYGGVETKICLDSFEATRMEAQLPFQNSPSIVDSGQKINRNKIGVHTSFTASYVQCLKKRLVFYKKST